MTRGRLLSLLTRVAVPRRAQSLQPSHRPGFYDVLLDDGTRLVGRKT